MQHVCQNGVYAFSRLHHTPPYRLQHIMSVAQLLSITTCITLAHSVCATANYCCFLFLHANFIKWYCNENNNKNPSALIMVNNVHDTTHTLGDIVVWSGAMIL